MENRDRDKVSRNNTGPTEGGKVNRDTSSDIGNQNDDSTAEFGQKIGRSENLDEPNSRQSDSVGESGMKGSQSSESKSNLGENIDNVRFDRSGRFEREH